MPGPYHVGRAFELLVGVIAKGKEPKIDPPAINGAPRLEDRQRIDDQSVPRELGQ